MPKWRTQLKNVYGYCQRCSRRQPLSQMQWQNGLLLCRPSGCVDSAIVGSRDLNVARQVATDRRELQPDEKLTQPTTRVGDNFEVLY